MKPGSRTETLQPSAQRAIVGHLDYYQYQVQARGIRTLDDVVRSAESMAYIYDRIVLPWLPSDKARPTAEMACGHGAFLWWLKARGFTRLTGVDSSAEQVAMARQVGVTVEQADVNQWLGRQPEAGLAVIVGIDLIEHLSKDDFMEFLRHSRRALGPGGRLILRYPNGDSPMVGLNLFNDITHVWTYTSNCLRTLAGMHGFSAVHFVDQCAAIRDRRWLKVPLSRISTLAVRMLFRAATRENVLYWGPHLWACLEKSESGPQP